MPTLATHPVPLPRPTLEKAADLAGDIVELAGFYDVPVDLLLGIGAMEYNFLYVPGDLNNEIWKKGVETDDTVLRRRGRKSWVLKQLPGDLADYTTIAALCARAILVRYARLL